MKDDALVDCTLNREAISRAVCIQKQHQIWRIEIVEVAELREINGVIDDPFNLPPFDFLGLLIVISKFPLEYEDLMIDAFLQHVFFVGAEVHPTVLLSCHARVFEIHVLNYLSRREDLDHFELSELERLTVDNVSSAINSQFVSVSIDFLLIELV